MKKRICSFLLALLVACSSAAPAFASAGSNSSRALAGTTIHVYNWGEYISKGTDGSMDVNAEFTRRTGIQVDYTTFDTNESLYSKLAGGGAQYDVIVPSDYMINKLIKQNMLEKLDYQNIPNCQYIDKQYRNLSYDPKGTYSVPYTWGTVGILYNKKYVKKEETTSWDILWDKKYAGKILMFDNPRDAFGIAQKKLGISYNTTDSNEWEAAAALLKQQKPLVQSYVMDQIFDKMDSGEAWVAPYYAGDGESLSRENPNIGFTIPTKQGTNFFVDALCVPKGCQNKAAAEAYINFLCSPEVSAANMQTIGYSTPETAARKLLPKEMAQSMICYPPQSILDKAEVFTNLPDKTLTLIDELWTEVKMGGSGDTLTLIFVLCAFLAVYVGIVIYKKQKQKKEME
ncbi:MAG: spermidine/putrescine ABC transporter substrate-binding protein [Oscillospiraceae bacterium]|nr:spermidine/putrescine ABC transporter substrate-binding protein [Oscillospiraceae bacterium]